MTLNKTFAEALLITGLPLAAANVAADGNPERSGIIRSMEIPLASAHIGTASYIARKSDITVRDTGDGYVMDTPRQDFREENPGIAVNIHVEKAPALLQDFSVGILRNSINNVSAFATLDNTLAKSRIADLTLRTGVFFNGYEALEKNIGSPVLPFVALSATFNKCFSIGRVEACPSATLAPSFIVDYELKQHDTGYSLEQERKGGAVLLGSLELRFK